MMPKIRKTILHIVLVSLGAILGACSPGNGLEQRRTFDDRLVPYVEFLEQPRARPVDYILELFDEHDLVIVCERFHGETTQWDLLYDVVRDERFATGVGHVFTELGGSNLQPALDDLMAAPGLDDDTLRRRLLELYRNLSFLPLWSKSNFFGFLERVYRLNQGVPPGERIVVHFSDMPFDWKGMTAERYGEFRKTLAQRDRVMARRVIEGVHDLAAAGDRRAKALVVMNFRHAFNDFTDDSGEKRDNVGRYLFEAFPGRVANVMLNSVALLPGTTDARVVVRPLQEGRWDAAFDAAGVAEAAFDFAGSPFGADPFDYHFRYAGGTTYADVFDGFVFYKPLREHRHHSAVAGLFDDGFATEYARRLEVAGVEVPSAEELADYVEGFDAIGPEPYDDMEALQASIAGWLDR